MPFIKKMALLHQIDPDFSGVSTISIAKDAHLEPSSAFSALEVREPVHLFDELKAARLCGVTWTGPDGMKVPLNARDLY